MRQIWVMIFIFSCLVAHHFFKLFFCSCKFRHLSFLDQNLDLGSLLTGVAAALDGDSEDEEDLSHLPPEIKQLREKERRSANNAREVLYILILRH